MTRQISIVRIVPLHGSAVECASVQEAIHFVRAYHEETAPGPLVKYEIQVRYDNGDRVDAQFQRRQDAIEFLDRYSAGNWTPLN